MFISSLRKSCKKYLMMIALLCLPNIAYTQGLGELLHQVEKVAPQLRAASAQAAASEAGIRVVKSQYWGHAEVFGRDTHYNKDRLVNPIAYPSVLTRSLFDRNTLTYGAAFTLPIDIDGRITAKVNAQEHLSQAASQGVKQTRLDLFSQTSTLYRGLQRLEGVKQALKKQYKALLEHRKITEISVRVGRVAAVELLRIEAEIKSVEGQLASLSGDEAHIRSALGALLNKGSYSAPVSLLKYSPTTILVEGNQQDVLKNRPDLQVADSVTQAQDENLKGARREWLPSLSFRAETMRNQGYIAAGENTWSIMGQMSWELWDGGRRFARTDQMHANREIAKQQYQTVFNQAQAELQSSIAAWQAAAHQLQASTAGLKASIETERIQSDRFSSGRISAVDLVDAEASLARARADHTSALANLWLADDQYRLARGETPLAYQQEQQHAE